MSRFARWAAIGMIACLAIAASSAVAGTSARAKDESTARTDPVLDLVDQAPANGSTPAVVTFSVADAETHADAVLRIRLYEPVRTREELWAAATGPAPTPQSSSWVVQDWRTGAADGTATVVSVPVAPPEETGASDQAGPASSGPRPLHIELSNVDGTPIDTLRTFLLPAGVEPAGPDNELAVAVIVDLRLPPAHSPDGSATFDQAFLERVLDMARVLIDHPDMPLTVHLSPESLDALALIGDDESLSILRSAVAGRQLLVAPWTSLDIDDWIAADRADVVIDGLDRGNGALEWAGLEASTIMRFDSMPSLAAARLLTDLEAGITGFVGSPVFNTPLVAPDPVTVAVDSAGSRQLVVQADPLLEVAMRNHDAELAAQWAAAELTRMRLGSDGAEAVAVIVSALIVDWDARNLDGRVSVRPFLTPGTEPAAAGLLLEGLEADRSLEPVTVDSLFAGPAPDGSVRLAAARQPDGSRDFNLYLARRTQVEQRLHARESLLGNERAGTAPLHTLLAASANAHLSTGERAGFLDAVDEQVVLASGVDFLERGRITVTERAVDLPITLVNNRSAPLTVAVELISHRLRVTEGERLVFTLQPGRNDLAVPVVSTSPGSTLVTVTVTTPDEAGVITLATGTFRVRFADTGGFGLLVLIWAVVALGAWWLHSRRKRPRDARSGSATVAAPGSVGVEAENPGETGTTPPTGDHTEDLT